MSILGRCTISYQTQVSTSTLNNQSINAALIVHTWTNNTRLREVWINVYVTDIVGNGDYTAYITQQRAGAGVWYESVKTTKAVAAGIVSIMFNSIPLTVNATDVVRVYLLGLAGDNVNAVDIITEINEEYVNVDATGSVAVGTFAAGAIDAAAIADGAIDAATFAAGAIDAAAIATDAIDADALATDAADEIADEVWDELIAGHLGVGSTGEALNGAGGGGGAITLNAEITEIHVT